MSPKINDNEVRSLATDKGFIEFQTLDAPVLQHQSAFNTVYFHMSGGRCPEYQGNIHGRSTIYSILRRSPMEQWNRDFRNEWTMLKEQSDETLFVDYHMNNRGEQQLLAGKITDYYPKKISKEIKEKWNYKEFAKKTRNYKNELYEVDILTLQDRITLELRDKRWNQYFYGETSSEPNYNLPLILSFGCMSSIVSLLGTGMISWFTKIPHMTELKIAGFSGIIGMGIALYGLYKYNTVTSQTSDNQIELNFDTEVYGNQVIELLNSI